MELSVIIVDDHPVISHGLKHALSKSKGLNYVGEADDAVKALKLVEKFHPDVVILDISLEGSNGINLISQILLVSKDTSVIMYTTHNSKNYIIQSLKAGAYGYVLKSDKMDTLIQAIHDASQKKIFLSSSLPKSILPEIIAGGAKNDSLSSLTPREYEIGSLIASGEGVDKIGKILFISPKTVRVHRTNIMHKFSCKNVHELLLQLRQYFPQ